MELGKVIKMATKCKSQGPRCTKKTIWTKLANLDKTQGLKWQFTRSLEVTLGIHPPTCKWVDGETKIYQMGQTGFIKRLKLKPLLQ
ncbi:hypothetical protein HanRHA438_Chr03g0124301 [Helianthus annuus]|nr:hypothetical protein HanRHA438_Chr03g0124301 [Helianthus annuus]